MWQRTEKLCVLECGGEGYSKGRPERMTMEYRMKWGSDGQKSRPPVSMRVLLQVWEKALALLVSLFFPLTVLQRGEALAHGHGVLERSKVSNVFA